MVKIKKFNEEYSPLLMMLAKNVEDIANFIKSKYPDCEVKDEEEFFNDLNQVISKHVIHPSHNIPKPETDFVF